MSTFNQTDLTSGNLQASSTHHSSSSSQAAAASQLTYQEISRWSPDTDSDASEHQSSSQRSAGGIPATHRSSTSTEPNSETIEEHRARTAFALENGGPPASPEKRTGETYTARITKNPTANQHESSRIHGARRARRRQCRC
ncbi:uncharacterized protein PADG_07005 [Paracoccidioides brasiliensis Pb18]|uniref:Uncharacterized protein n=2 Tax=Paracoccidioides brasiliensis TaxID=121759 RepID=C1GIB9_PARBD|nr:uncharacterized protein PADG_07005 [Paracoccidioides brasiliensis Pb18]EEH42185.2 hypothetical protein PADG_07005 [Paracoccidioides brasiliensis Pb18]ODH49209.1 hypothetical protein GX48_04716 [Paracoccidioides brasiliensis]